jgi:hypothetical protein
MVELTLPKNSRMTVGKTWPKPEGEQIYALLRYTDGTPTQVKIHL